MKYIALQVTSTSFCLATSVDSFRKFIFFQKSGVQETLNLLTCAKSSKQKNLVSSVTCHVSGVMCHLLCVTCNKSLLPTATATDRLPAMHSMQDAVDDPSIMTGEELFFDQFMLDLFKMGIKRRKKKSYNIHTDIAIYKLNRRMANAVKNLESFCQAILFVLL